MTRAQHKIHRTAHVRKASVRRQHVAPPGTPVRDNDNLKSHKYVCITTYQPDTKSNLNPNPNPNPTTKQHAVVNIELNIVTCPTYPDKFIRDNVVAPSVPTSVVIVTLARHTSQQSSAAALPIPTPLKLSLLAGTPDCPRPRCCCCCCRPAVVGTPYERRQLHS